jgi:acetoin utilization protein AcuA
MIEIWSQQHRPAVVRPVPGFAAVVNSERLVGTVGAVIDGGGWVVAEVRGGELVGYASIVRPEPLAWPRWWDALDGLLELGAIEVARPFRHSGIGRILAEVIAQDERIDDVVLFGVGVMHHWDLGWSSLPPFVHRTMLEATLRHAGMTTVPTTDPEVQLHPANALFARMGARVDAARRAAFVDKAAA